MCELDDFLRSTEETKVGIGSSVKKSIEYPFMYLTEITDVEIAHLVEAGILLREPTDSSCMQLFLKMDGYRLLGYVRLCFDTVIHINYLREHEVMLKASKDSQMSLAGELMENLLLSG